MSAFTVTPKQMSELPDQVKIGPIVFKVTQVESPTAKDQDGNEVPVFGKITFKSAEIVIDKDLEPATKWQCFWHEVFHGMFETLGLGPQGNGEGEGQVDALAYVLLGVLIDNGWLVRGDFPAPETTRYAAYPFTLEKK